MQNKIEVVIWTVFLQANIHLHLSVSHLGTGIILL